MKKFWEYLKNLFKTKTPDPVVTKPVDPPVRLPVGEPPWMTVAKRELAAGISEIPGSKHNPRIIEYHKVTSLKATTDEVPWCASFACWCLLQCGLWHPRSARAKDFATDKFYRLRRPIYGCIVVYTRKGGGHVDFYISGYTSGSIKGLGGNESNRVAANSQSESSVVGYYWPRDFELPEGAAIA